MTGLTTISSSFNKKIILLISVENGKINNFRNKSEIKKYSGWFVKNNEESNDSLRNLNQPSRYGNLTRLNKIILSIITDQKRLN